MTEREHELHSFVRVREHGLIILREREKAWVGCGGGGVVFSLEVNVVSQWTVWAF